MADQETKQLKVDKTFTQKLLERGYNNFYVSAKAEDLENPDDDYISTGYVDANGNKVIFITEPVDQAVMRAEYILKKYKKSQR